MSIIIAKLYADGVVRSVELVNKQNIFRIIPILHNFYSNSERLDKLLDNGDLYIIGPSMGDWLGINDTIHCRAIKKESYNPNAYNARHTNTREEFLSGQDREYILLFENGRWTVIHKGSEIDSRLFDENIFKEKEVKGLCIVQLKNGAFTEINFYHSSWQEMIFRAAQYETPVYIFRGMRLIKKIESKPDKKKVS